VADDDDLMWTVASSGAAIAAAMGAKKVLSKGWVKRRGKAPGNPATDETTWGEALAWAVVSGVVVGIVRLIAQRGVAFAFQKKGRLPAKATEEATA